MESFLNVSSSDINIFWDYFHNSYDINLKGIKDKVHILSIIAEKFSYKKIINELEVINLLTFQIIV